MPGGKPIDNPDPAAEEVQSAGADKVGELEDVLDLSGEQSETEGLLVPREKPYDPKRDRERKRGQIAIVLIWLLVGTIVLSFLALLAPWVSVDELKSFLELIIAPLVALVGAATGFYFGGNSE